MVPEICNKHFPHLIFATKNPKNQNLKKMKEMPGDIIILHKNRKLKNEKNDWEISSFYTCVPKIMIR